MASWLGYCSAILSRSKLRIFRPAVTWFPPFTTGSNPSPFNANAAMSSPTWIRIGRKTLLLHRQNEKLS